MDKGQWLPTEEGTPQGGPLSPLLANIALHGLEERIQRAFPRQRTTPAVIRYADEVRHITWRQIPFTERRGTEELTSGSTTYLEAKAEGNTSMSLKRSTAEGVYGVAPQDPRAMGRATLPKPQFPAMEAYILCPQRLMTESSR